MLRRALATRLGAARRALRHAATPRHSQAPFALPCAPAACLGAFCSLTADAQAGGAVQEGSKTLRDATGAAAAAAESNAFAPAATPAGGDERIEKAAGMGPVELTAEDYQQLTPEEFAAVADLYLGEPLFACAAARRRVEGHPGCDYQPQASH